MQLPPEVANPQPEAEEPTIKPEQAGRLLARALPKIAKFAGTVGLANLRAVGTNDVEAFSFRGDAAAAKGEITLRGGMRFFVLGEQVTGFRAPDTLFTWDREVDVRRFLGTRRIRETQAVEMVRETVTKLGFPASVVAYAPQVDRPCGAARELIPRYLLRWHPSKPGWGTLVRAEVDAEGGKLKSLTVRDVLLR